MNSLEYDIMVEYKFNQIDEEQALEKLKLLYFEASEEELWELIEEWSLNNF